ncbi:MAG: glycosyltransferase family 2 protein [Acidimicrobiia bacterium]|nr:glycosyltransferase family 2 protein [Acidimicrobiia bacterium]
MYSGHKVSVVLPTYNERESIRATIEAFEATGVVDEIIVVNNNAAAGTSDEVVPTSAREVFETTQGYGAAIRRGLDESSGDLICIAEPDGTFDANDIFKLLAYSRDVDVVYGSRTVGEFIWNGANMDFTLRFGNWAVAKLIEVLFDTNSLSDVGCTYRLLNRKALGVLRPFFTVDGSHFGPEMICLSVIADLSIVQIPVNYKQRVGQSSVTGDMTVAVRLGAKMIALILSHRLKARRLRARIRRTAKQIGQADQTDAL